MWMAVLIIACVGYVVYRTSFSVRSVRASRAGDRQRAEALSRKGKLVFLGVTGVWTLAVVVFVVALVLTR